MWWRATFIVVVVLLVMKANGSVLSVNKLGSIWDTPNPFLFCAYHKDAFPKGEENMGPHPSLLRGRNIGQDFTVKDGFRMYHGDTGISGFPQHPHRGFETITIVTEGVVDHHDSMSAKARFGGGGSDTQWVTTGSGIQHSEMFPLVKREENNPLELFQIWLNLPAKNKMCKPYFTMLWSEKNPVVVSEDKKSKVTVICDQSKIVVKESRQVTPPPDSWASQEGSDVAVMLIDVEAGSTYTLPAAKFRETKRTIYMFEGSSVKVNGTTIQKLESASLSPLDEVEINNEFGENCRFLLLQGKPINEPVVQRGPFVLNTQEELMQTFRDYQRTQFGGWPWSSHAPVHPREQKRFCQHADGKIEYPDQWNKEEL